jgi:hypothetical protein
MKSTKRVSTNSVECLFHEALSLPQAGQQFRVEGGLGIPMIGRVIAGVVKDDGPAGEVPFFSIKVHMTTLAGETGIEAGTVVVTTMRYGGTWVTTLVPGDRPCFKLDQYTHPIPEILEKLLRGQAFGNGVVMFAASEASN